jgi:broad specificity phosphatase PhoE
MRALISALLALLLSAGSAATLPAQGEPVTVFVVRHAERAPGNPDPPLSRAGRTRALALDHLLADAGITAVFTSEFVRTRETADPLAKRLGVTPTRVDARDLKGLQDRIAALPAGSRALIVSHSNIVPLIVRGLTGVDVGELTENDYDRLYVVTIRGPGSGEVLLLHFGTPAGG